MAARDGVSPRSKSATAMCNRGSITQEQDQFSEAPEVDLAAYAPEQVPHQGLQVSDTDPPPLLPYDDGVANNEKHVAVPAAGSEASQKSRYCRLSGRVWTILLALLALALGIGLGLGLRKSHSVSETSPPNPVLAHGVCNDSSLAALTTSDGTRHVFFQDANGTLRQAQLSTTTGAWTTSLNFVIPNTTDARNNTPITAMILEESTAITTPILLLYITQNNNVAATMFNYQDSQSWENASTFFNVSQYATRPESRSLFIAQIPDTNSSSKLSLWFENSDGRVTGLLGSHVQILPNFTPTILETFWAWADALSSIEAAQSPTPITAISAPFSILPYMYYPVSDNSSTPELHQVLNALFFVPNAAPEASVLYAISNNGNWSTQTSGSLVPDTADTNKTTPYTPGTPSVDDAAVQASDWIHT
ncbi:hypothetical protein MMC10_002688 [Thelotrema lepadinum]|nr:hypothetical protein [Thelotrema lepadinum]